MTDRLTEVLKEPIFKIRCSRGECVDCGDVCIDYEAWKATVLDAIKVDEKELLACFNEWKANNGITLSSLTKRIILNKNRWLK